MSHSQSVRDIRRVPGLALANPAVRSFDNTQHHVEMDIRIVDLVIGPCPSALFEHIVRDRMSTNGLRSSMRRLFSLNCSALTTAGAVSVFGDAMSTMESCLRMMARDLQGSVEAVSLSNGHTQSAPYTECSRWAACTMYAKQLTVRSGRMRAYLMMLMKLCSDLHTQHFSALNVYDLEAVLAEGLGWRGLGGRTSPQNPLEPFERRRRQWLATITAWDQIPFENDREGSDHSDGEYQDEDDDQRGTLVSTKAIISVIDDIVTSCVRLVNISVLCSWKSRPKGGANGGDDALHDGIKEVIADHHAVIKQLLDVFLLSNETFQRLPGQTNRTNFMKYLVVHDSQLATLLQPTLSLIGVELSPLPFLLGREGLRSAVHLYSRGLVAETRMWLSKTIHQSKTKRENTHNLPWDIETVGEKVISALPETLRFQMNPYTDLIVQSHVSHTPSPDGHRSRIDYCEDDVDMSESDKAMWQHIGLHEQILRAICKSMILLAQEYNLTLNSRHWELPASQVMGHAVQSKHVTSSDTSTRDSADSEHLMFLVAVANDSFRVSNVHLSELLRIDSAVDWSESTNRLIQAVTTEFQLVSERAITLIVRVIFFDLLAILSNFNSLWTAHGSLQQTGPGTFVPPSPVMGIIATINDFLSDIQSRIEPTLFFEVVCACADAIVIRYLIFLKSRAEAHQAFSGDDVARIQMDVMNLINAFRKLCEFEMHHYLNPLSRALSTLADAVFIISSTTRNDENFIQAMKTLAHQKKDPSKEDKDTIQEALTALLGLSVAKSANAAAEAAEVTRLVSVAMAPLPFNSPLHRISSPTDGPLIRAFRTGHDAVGGSGGGKGRHGAFSSKGSSNSTKKHIRIEETELKRKMGLMDLARSHSHEKVDGAPKIVRRGSDEMECGMNVIIRDIQSRGLVSRAVIGKANPYVVISYFEQRVKTSVKWNTNNPQWSDVLQLSDISTSTANKMIDVRVYDKERLARKTLLGAVTVSIDGVDLHPTKSWFALSGGDIGCGGDIYLNITGERINSSSSTRPSVTALSAS